MAYLCDVVEGGETQFPRLGITIPPRIGTLLIWNNLHTDGSPNGDWVLEENMVAPVHLLYPGGEHERVWLEEVVHITKDGGRPLFSWGFDPLVA